MTVLVGGAALSCLSRACLRRFIFVARLSKKGDRVKDQKLQKIAKTLLTVIVPEIYLNK